MPHVIGHAPPLPPSTGTGLPPALPGTGVAPGPGSGSGTGTLGKLAGMSPLVGAAIGGVLGFLVGGPIGALVGAAAGAGALMLARR